MVALLIWKSKFHRLSEHLIFQRQFLFDRFWDYGVLGMIIKLRILGHHSGSLILLGRSLSGVEPGCSHALPKENRGLSWTINRAALRGVNSAE